MTAIQRVSGGTAWVAAPQSMEEAFRFCEVICRTDFVPKDLRGNAGAVLACIQYGAELGIPPMQAMQNIMVTNGRPSMWGDLVLAMVLANPTVLDVVETFDDATMTAKCVVIRKRGERERIVEQNFSKDDAIAAKLWGKNQSPWVTYPKRMLKMRARGWALRDACPDILKGMYLREEAEDFPEVVKGSGVVESYPGAAAYVAAAATPEVEKAKDAVSESRYDRVWFLYSTSSVVNKLLADVPAEKLTNYITRLERDVERGSREGADEKTQRIGAEAKRYLERAHEELERRMQQLPPELGTGDPIADALRKEHDVVNEPDDGNGAWGLTAEPNNE